MATRPDAATRRLNHGHRQCHPHLRMHLLCALASDQNVVGVVDCGLHLAASYASLMPTQNPIDLCGKAGVENKKAVKTDPGGMTLFFKGAQPQKGSESDLTAFTCLAFHCSAPPVYQRSPLACKRLMATGNPQSDQSYASTRAVHRKA